MLALAASFILSIGGAAATCPSPRTDAALPIRVPIEVANNHVYVKVCAGGRELSFILDTGAGQSFFDLTVANSVGLTLGRQFRASGAGAGTIAGAAVENGSVALEGSGV